MRCKWCKSKEVMKNGKKADGRQQWMCKECGGQMVERPKKKRMTEEDIERAIKMRDEGMSYRAIARTLGYSVTAIIYNVRKNVNDTMKYMYVSFILELFALFWRKGWILSLLPYCPHHPSLRQT